jgi:hypothetical protein
MRRVSMSICKIVSCLLFLTFVTSARSAWAAATITIVNLDGAGEGFNDPTPVAPIGGNTGTTVGQQRLNVFEFAANTWGANLDSVVEIKVGARFNPLSCSPTSGVLGSAGPNTFAVNFIGAPIPNTLYAIALANSLAGVDLAPGQEDIRATFNSDVGTAGCLTSSGWYYGLDAAAPANRIDLASVVLHELGHGLGFLSLVNLTSGAKAAELDDAYMRFLENHSTGELYPDMTNGERVTASKSGANLHWIGAHVIAAATGLSAGREPVSGHVEMYAPSPQEPGSSVSHYSKSLLPNEMMEPAYTSPNHNVALTLALFKDIGWNPTSPMCGDGIVEDGEQCDPADADSCDPGSVCNSGCTACVPLPPGQPVAGRKLQVLDKASDASKRKVSAQAKDPGIVAPAPNGTTDPRVNGAVVELLNPSTGEHVSISLPAANWKGLGNPAGASGYSYKDIAPLEGPCTSASLKNGQWKVSCAGSQISFTLNESSQGSLSAQLRIGSQKYCTLFGGTIVKDAPTVGASLGAFLAKNAPAPAICPTAP